MNESVCCFTGHRKIPQDKIVELNTRLEEEVENLIHQGVCVFRIGGAKGFDMLAACVIIKMQLEFPFIRFELILPYKIPSTKPDKFMDTYGFVPTYADYIEYTSERYYRGCMQKRDRRLVEDCQVCICWQTQSTGGTSYTVDYAKKKGLRIINIAED